MRAVPQLRLVELLLQHVELELQTQAQAAKREARRSELSCSRSNLLLLL